MQQLTGKNIWITGATSGIGQALALRLAEQGNTVYISGRNSAALAALNQKIPARLVPLPCDVTDAESLADAEKCLREYTDSLDILILNAGTCEYVDSASLSLPLFERVFAVNFFAAIRCLSVALPLLKKAQRRGLIVGMSSLSTVVGLPRAEAYGASKAAFQYLMDSLRVDVRNQKIDVLVVQPGFIETPMTAKNDFPMPFMKDVDYAVDNIVHGMTKRLSHTAFPWQLAVLLRLAACFKGLWYRCVAPKLARHNQL